MLYHGIICCIMPCHAISCNVMTTENNFTRDSIFLWQKLSNEWKESFFFKTPCIQTCFTISCHVMSCCAMILYYVATWQSICDSSQDFFEKKHIFAKNSHFHRKTHVMPCHVRVRHGTRKSTLTIPTILLPYHKKSLWLRAEFMVKTQKTAIFMRKPFHIMSGYVMVLVHLYWWSLLSQCHI